MAKKKRFRLVISRHPKNPNKNIAAGYYDEDNIFHPIRASFDCKSKRVGESAKRKSSKKKA